MGIPSKKKIEDENLHRRSWRMACTAYLLNGGAEVLGLDWNQVDLDSVDRFGWEVLGRHDEKLSFFVKIVCFFLQFAIRFQERNYLELPFTPSKRKLSYIAPEKWWLEDDPFLFGPGPFSGAKC